MAAAGGLGGILCNLMPRPRVKWEGLKTSWAWNMRPKWAPITRWEEDRHRAIYRPLIIIKGWCGTSNLILLLLYYTKACYVQCTPFTLQVPHLPL